MCFCLKSVIFFNLVVFGFCEKELIRWDMNAFCGSEISSIAGEVQFDAQSLITTGNYDGCSLTIKASPLHPNGDNMLMFYFTTFELQPDCDNINVTVTDGNHKTDDIIRGLPRYICKSNYTVTQQIFSTSGDSLSIQVNVKNEDLRSYSGHFGLKFISYHTGNCDEQYGYQCSNGHCIHEHYNCSMNIKACGDADDNCSTETTEEPENWFTNIVRYFFILIGIICIMFLLKAMVREGKKKCGNFADHVDDCCISLKLKCSHCRHSINFSRFPKPRLPQFIRQRLRQSARETADEQAGDTTDDSHTVTSDVINLGFSNIDERTDQTDTHYSPTTAAPRPITSHSDPPSYEEVLTSSTYSIQTVQTEDPAPPYEEQIYYNRRLSSLHAMEYPTNTEEDNSQNNNSVSSLEADDIDNATNERIMTSNMIIQSSLNTDTSSVLNYYLSDFGVELSDNYSSDPDWDSQSNSSVSSEEELPTVPSERNDSNEEVPPSPPTYDVAVPPPYYYDYIANVGLYKHDSVAGSNA